VSRADRGRGRISPHPGPHALEGPTDGGRMQNGVTE
jgi:hypothetical protein